MLPTENSQQYLSPFEANAPRDRSRQLSGSIWAPRPQPSEGTWPRTLDSFSRVAEREYAPRGPSEPRNNAHNLPLVTREDVFGPLPSAPPPQTRHKDVGTIGDGRKNNTPEFDDSHVEQLLRTLNLNSPAPYTITKKPALSLNFDISPSSPDFSPASATSALLTPTDLSPGRPLDPKLHPSSYDLAQSLPYLPPSSLLFEHSSPGKFDARSANSPQLGGHNNGTSYRPMTHTFPFFEPFSENPTPAPQASSHSLYTAVPSGTSGQGQNQALYSSSSPARRTESGRNAQVDWRLLSNGSQVHKAAAQDFMNSMLAQESQVPLRASFPINFLSLLHPSSSPPYHVFVARIIKSSDQQASIFLQQKLKVADTEERAKIVDAICSRGFDMMAHRFGNWAVQRCLEAASTPEERRKIVGCMKGRIVDLATNCYGCHVLQKALDCEEDIRLLIVSELLLGDPAQTLVNKHASHVWSKIMELSWTPPAPPIFQYVNKSLKGKWASLACHETGSLVVQHAFENLEDEAKDGIVDELLNRGPAVFAEVAKNQWGSYCIQHILEHGSEKHRMMTLDHLLDGLLDFAINEQGAKSVTKSLKEGGKDTLARVVKRMCEPAKGARRPMIVDLALSVTGSQLIASVLPTADKDQRAALYDCIRGHIVTLRGCKTGSKVIWLLCVISGYPSPRLTEITPRH
ncbi:ARM repeat-containing protein [Pluteus cervinus]|uniref:ARM repeat-containing protein n=1 Tax=Pluteus cervinus TaxID=181527 RepID=A0ACD3AVN0_9AGAR|nr:ARM repeat-containing protein [Pluteus cervinus]